MKLILNFIHFLICLPIAGFLLVALEIYYFKGFKKRKKPVYQAPTLKIKHSIVPESFNKKFVWDENLYTNKILIKA